MPKRRSNAERQAPKPLIQIERVVFEKASFKLSTGTLTSIAEYAMYIKHATGDEPTQDEIVEKGMQRLFDSDRGFRQWLGRNGEKAGIAIPAARNGLMEPVSE